MPESPTTSAKRAARLVAPIGVASALLAGGFVFATVATAATATAPTVTLSMPAQLSNDNGARPAHLTIDNSATGNAAITAAALHTTFTVPAALACNKITVKVGATPAVVSGTSPTCTIDSPFSAAAGSVTSVDFTVAVDGTIPATLTAPASTVTGTISTVTQLNQLTGVGGTFVSTLATSNTATTALVDPTAPALATTVPAATVHQDYSQTLISTLGFAKTPTTITVYKHLDSATATTCTTVQAAEAVNTDPSKPDTTITLANGFVLDATTGKLAATAASLDITDHAPNYSYVVVLHNGVGGAAGTGCDATANTNDVATSFKLPVLFSDTPVDSQFGTAIYTLSDAQIIGGYADGTFRGAGTVTRQAFAHFVAEYNGYSTGTCSTFNGSAFPDVSNSSPFCQDIKALASEGIVSGYADGGFHPSATISRQAISAFLYRLHAVNNNVDPTNLGDATCTTPTPFSDVKSSNPFCGDIEWLVTNKIASGYADGGFHPASGSSRQATASFLYKVGVLEDHDYS